MIVERVNKEDFDAAVRGWKQAVGIVTHQHAALAWCLDQFHALAKAGLLPKDEELARGFHEIVKSAHKTGADYINAMTNN